MQDPFSSVWRDKLAAAIDEYVGVRKPSDPGVPSAPDCGIVSEIGAAEPIMHPVLKGYLTVPEASARSGISRAQLTLLLRRRTLEGIPLPREWLISEQSLNRYMANRPKRGPKPHKKAPKSS